MHEKWKEREREREREHAQEEKTRERNWKEPRKKGNEKKNPTVTDRGVRVSAFAVAVALPVLAPPKKLLEQRAHDEVGGCPVNGRIRQTPVEAPPAIRGVAIFLMRAASRRVAAKSGQGSSRKVFSPKKIFNSWNSELP